MPSSKSRQLSVKLRHSLSRSLICPLKLADSASKALNLASKDFFLALHRFEPSRAL